MEHMKITSAKYFFVVPNEICGIKAVIDSVENFVPLDPANRHYAEILRQVEAGTLTIEPADTPE